MTVDVPTLPYRLAFRPRSGSPGAHRGLGEWTEGEFYRHMPLIARFDPRRIDLLGSVRDPFGSLHIRAFAPRRAVPVIVLADLSASMGFGGDRSALVRLAEFTRVIAASAYASGDSFGLIGADRHVREEVFIRPTRRRGLADEVYEKLLDAAPATNARGLIDAVHLLPQRRSLVFLVSDFLIPPEDVETILDSAWRHEIVPIVLRDSVVEGDLPAFGLAAVRDLETGGKGFVLIRPSLRAAWRRAAKDRLAALERIFAERGRRAFHLAGRLDVDALADFLAGA